MHVCPTSCECSATGCETYPAKTLPVRVDTEAVKCDVIKAISNTSIRRILVSCCPEAKTVARISTELGLPLSTAYHYVSELAKAGLLSIERIIVTDDGKRYETYRSVIREIRAIIGSDNVVIEILPNEDVVGRFYRLWSSLKEWT